MVYPNTQCYHFCYWMLNVSWQTLTPSRLALIQTVYTAASTGASVTVTQFNNFTQVTAWRYPYYLVWANTAGSPPIEAFEYFKKWSVQPSATFQNYIWTFINTLKGAGQWQYLKAFWLLAVPTADGALINMANPNLTPASLIGAPTFTANQGYNGFNATKSINLNYVPGVDDNTYQNNCEFGSYSRNNTQEASFDMGASLAAGASAFAIQSRIVNGTANGSLNSALFNSAVATTGLALTSIKRVSPTLSYILVRGVVNASPATVSSGPNSYPLYIGSQNRAGVITSPTTKQISMGYVASAQLNNLLFYNAVQALMTSIGCQV